jgi:hypothetical protein
MSTFEVKIRRIGRNKCVYLRMSKWKELYKRYFPYFVDFWQYIVIILIFILAVLFIL